MASHILIYLHFFFLVISPSIFFTFFSLKIFKQIGVKLIKKNKKNGAQEESPK